MSLKFSRRKTLLIISGLSVAAFVMMALKPLPRPTRENCRQQSGNVVKVEVGEGHGDIVISLQGDDHYYYINRGQERGLSLNCLTAKLQNRKIELLTIKHWTPLDPSSNTRHVARIECEGEEIYSEL